MGRLTVEWNTEMYYGEPPKESYDFPPHKRNKYMSNHPMCQLCEKKKSQNCVQIVHADPDSWRYDEDKLISHIESVSNMIALCKFCHKKIDEDFAYRSEHLFLLK